MTANGLEQLLVARQTMQYLDAVRRLPIIAAGKELILERLDLRPGQRALNVGCGTGEDVWALAERVAPGGYAEGIDLNPWTIGEARRRAAAGAVGPSVIFRVGDVYALPYDDASFDAVCSERMFTHLTDPLRALREIGRVLRPGGVAVIADPDFPQQQAVEIVDICHRRGVKVRIAPSTMEILVHRAEFVPGEAVPLFELRSPVFEGFARARYASFTANAARTLAALTAYNLRRVITLIEAADRSKAQA